jgi:hypothetical protein
MAEFVAMMRQQDYRGAWGSETSKSTSIAYFLICLHSTHSEYKWSVVKRKPFTRIPDAL